MGLINNVNAMANAQAVRNSKANLSEQKVANAQTVAFDQELLRNLQRQTKALDGIRALLETLISTCETGT